MFKKGIVKLFAIVNSIIVVIILIPFAVIAFIPVLIFTETIEKRFRFLKKEGFKRSSDKKYVYYTKGELTFRFIMDISYMMKVGTGEYVNIYETNIGSNEERDNLKSLLAKYSNAHPVDKQRGEVNTVLPYSEYVRKHLYKLDEISDI